MYPSPIDVSPQAVNDEQLARLNRRLDAAPRPWGGTPLRAALVGAYGAVRRADLSDTRRFVLVVSDGVPTDGADEALALAREEADTGIRTLVVGISSTRKGTLYDPKFLAELAVAGGTARTETCDPFGASPEGCYYEGRSDDANLLRAAMTARLDEVRMRLLGCE